MFIARAAPFFSALVCAAKAAIPDDVISIDLFIGNADEALIVNTQMDRVQRSDGLRRAARLSPICWATASSEAENRPNVS